jgi:hypothetical protein
MSRQHLTILAISLAALTVWGCSNNDSNPVIPGSSDPLADLSVYMAPEDQAGVQAAWDLGPGHRWGDHERPWSYLLENGFDNYYEYKLTGRERLVGFRYVSFVAGDTATDGTDYVGWVVHAVRGEAHWDSLTATWMVNPGGTQPRMAYRYFRPIGNIDEARLMDWAPGFFIFHIARARFYYGPEARWVAPGIDWQFEHNYDGGVGEAAPITTLSVSD